MGERRVTADELEGDKQQLIKELNAQRSQRLTTETELKAEHLTALNALKEQHMRRVEELTRDKDAALSALSSEHKRRLEEAVARADRLEASERALKDALTKLEHERATLSLNLTHTSEDLKQTRSQLEALRTRNRELETAKIELESAVARVCLRLTSPHLCLAPSPAYVLLCLFVCPSPFSSTARDKDRSIGHKCQ